MLAGHFTTALIAKQKFPKGTFVYFLIISQLQDFLWLTSISLMINKDHLSPTTSNADEIGQPERNFFFIFIRLLLLIR